MGEFFRRVGRRDRRTLRQEGPSRNGWTIFPPNWLHRGSSSPLVPRRPRISPSSLRSDFSHGLLGDWTIEIIKRSDAAKGFVLLPRRWVGERTFAWLNRNRRLAKDFEATVESAVTWLYIASLQLMSRRLAAA